MLKQCHELAKIILKDWISWFLFCVRRWCLNSICDWRTTWTRAESNQNSRNPNPSDFCLPLDNNDEHPCFFFVPVFCYRDEPFHCSLHRSPTGGDTFHHHHRDHPLPQVTVITVTQKLSHEGKDAPMGDRGELLLQSLGRLLVMQSWEDTPFPLKVGVLWWCVTGRYLRVEMNYGCLPHDT